ncbi:MAG TPA: hypothetical protein VJW20_16010 [Candidatus Angelobacter sp.]|nr:hypothetical protein [Candidatus Angelobacter sp.]
MQPKFDAKTHCKKQGIPFCEVYENTELDATLVVNCRTSDAAIAAIATFREGLQYILLDRQHMNYMLLVCRLLDFEDLVKDDVFDGLPATRVIQDLALIRLAERSLNTIRGNATLSYGILSRHTVLFPHILRGFRRLMASGDDLSAIVKSIHSGVLRQFVLFHELAHVEFLHGVDHADARVVETVDVMAATHRLYKNKAVEDKSAGKNSYACMIVEQMANVMKSRSDMEEVIADLWAFSDLWQATKKLGRLAAPLLQFISDSVLKCVAASSLLGIFDNVIGNSDHDVIMEQSTRYRDICFVRFEFLVGYALIALARDFPDRDELFESINTTSGKIRARVFPLLNEELEFIETGNLKEIEESGRVLQKEKGLTNNMELIVACAACLGWIDLEAVQTRNAKA